MKRLFLLAIVSACTAHVTTSAPPPAQPAQPPPPAPSGQGGVAVAPTPPPPAPNPPPAKHPAYLHALTDLRAARAFLEKPAGAKVAWDEHKAVERIDAAIGTIKRASIDDGKNLNDHPPVDAAMIWGDRLHKARDLLEQSARDVNEAEENAGAKGLKAAALDEIKIAISYVDEGLTDAKKPHEPIHPAYMHAMANLRYARALLEKPAAADVKWDEQNGIREIDAALKEIHDARIDDGLPLTEHPVIESKMVYRDRLKEAMKLLNEAAHDVIEREANGFAKPDRAKAEGHIRNAEHAVKEAMEDRKVDKKEEKAEKREEKKEEKAGKGHGAMEKNH